ncbi:MAG: hypothetical protein V4438_00070 [Patescibacteria group bacterium]
MNTKEKATGFFVVALAIVVYILAARYEERKEIERKQAHELYCQMQDHMDHALDILISEITKRVRSMTLKAEPALRSRMGENPPEVLRYRLKKSSELFFREGFEVIKSDAEQTLRIVIYTSIQIEAASKVAGVRPVDLSMNEVISALDHDLSFEEKEHVDREVERALSITNAMIAEVDTMTLADLARK